MGTAANTKFIVNNAGSLAEQSALKTSAGAADADKIVALNDAGILDDSILNSKNSSAGAADAGKIPKLNASGVLDASIVNSKSSSAGAADAGKVVALDGSGRLDPSVLPVGIGADVGIVTASEALSAGDDVNIWNDAGAFKVRKADATTAGKESQGYVLAAVASGAPATVYFEGTNTAKSGLTPGPQFLSTTPGQVSGSAPTGSGNIVQRVGFAVSATAMNYQSGVPITLA